MPSRRQEKVSKVIQGSVSDSIQNHLSDPRIQGLVSVTRVDLSPDLRNATVFLSILGVDESQQKLTINAIQHAHGYVQSRLAAALSTKTCPSLKFTLDDSLKKSAAFYRLLDQALPHEQEQNLDSLEQDELDENSQPMDETQDSSSPPNSQTPGASE